MFLYSNREIRKIELTIGLFFSLPAFSEVFVTQFSNYLDNSHILLMANMVLKKISLQMDAIVDILYFVEESLDKEDKVINIFLDLSKAFDCVDLKLLIKKCEKLDI